MWWGTSSHRPVRLSLHKCHIGLVYFQVKKLSSARGHLGVHRRQHNNSLSNVKAFESQKWQVTPPLHSISSGHPPTSQSTWRGTTVIEFWKSNLNNKFRHCNWSDWRSGCFKAASFLRVKPRRKASFSVHVNNSSLNSRTQDLKQWLAKQPYT